MGVKLGKGKVTPDKRRSARGLADAGLAVIAVAAALWLASASAMPTVRQASAFLAITALGIGLAALSFRVSTRASESVEIMLAPAALLALTTLVPSALVLAAALLIPLAHGLIREASRGVVLRVIARFVIGSGAAQLVAGPTSALLLEPAGQGVGALLGALAFSIVSAPLACLDRALVRGDAPRASALLRLPALTNELSIASFAGLIAGCFAAHPLLALVPVVPLMLLLAMARRLEANERVVVEQQRALALAEAHLLRTERLTALGGLASRVAHELNNPLASILGAAELFAVEERLPASERRARRLLREARRAARIVQDLLAFARPREPRFGWHRLDAIVSEAVEVRGDSCALASIALHTDLPADLRMVHVDRHQLVQLLVNLLTNAEHAIRQDGRAGTILIRARRLSDERVEIAVDDDGPGIPAAKMPRIFEPFFTTKHDGSGTGLGLAICRGIADSHNASLVVRSTEGVGTCFALTLPPPPAEEPIEPDDTADDAITGGGTDRFAAGIRVLVVDDEDGVREVVAEALSAWGCEVRTAASAEEALALTRLSAPDIVITDLELRGGSGLDLHRGVRQGVGWVFMSGNPKSVDDAALFARSRCPLLAKPFALAQLRAALERALAGYRAAALEEP